MSVLTVPIAELAPISFEPLYGLATDPSESFFGWDIGDVESDNVDFLNMSPLNWFRSANEAPTDITEQLPTTKNVSLPSSSTLIRDAQPPDTPWVCHVNHTSFKLTLVIIIATRISSQ